MKIYFIIFIIFVFTLLTSNSYAEDTYAGYISGVYSTGQNVHLNKNKPLKFKFKYRKGKGSGWSEGASFFHIKGSSWRWSLRARVKSGDYDRFQLSSSGIRDWWNPMHSGFTNSMIATFNDGNWHDIEIYIHNDSSAFSNSLNSYVKIDNNHKLSLDSNHEDGSHYSKYRNGSGALVGKLFINGHGGGLNSEMKPLHYNGDMKDFEIYENGTLRYSFLKSIVVKTTSVLENQSVYNAESAGFKHGLGDKTYYSGYDKFHVPIYPNLDSESVLSDGGKRYKLIKVEGTGSASVASSSCNINTMSFLEDKCSLSLNSFYLGEDSTLKYTWQEQYKVNVAASGKDIADTISLNVTPLGGTSYTLAPGSRDYWLPKNAKVEVVVNAKDGDGKVLSSAQFAGKSLTNTKNTSTQRTYKLTDSLNSTGEARFHYSTQQWSLKTKVTRPINLDGSLVFSDSYAGLLNTLATPVQDGANSQISEKKFDHDSTIEPLVKTTIYDPNNPYVRYQLAEIYGTGSAKHLTGIYKSGDNINFESFKITDNTTIEYTWKKQHLINVGASASKLKGSPIIKIDNTNVISPKDNSVVLNGHDLDISFQYKLSSGQEPKVRDVFFSIVSPSGGLLYSYNSAYYPFVSNIVYPSSLAGLGYFYDTPLIYDGEYHSMRVVTTSNTIESFIDGTLQKSFFNSTTLGNSSSIKGEVVFNRDLPSYFHNVSYYGKFPGELKSLVIKSASTGELHYSSDRSTPTIQTYTGSNAYWVDDGAKVTLLMPISDTDNNLVTNGFLLTKSTASTAQSRAWERVTIDGVDYYQVTLSESMSLADAGKAEWQSGAKVYEFKAVLGQPFTLNKATVPEGIPSELNKVRAQVSPDILKAIQGGHKPAIVAAVENAPVNSSLLNSVVYSPFNVSSDELAEHSEFDGTLYFTRPGTYRLEWLLSGDDFPIEGGQGYPKLVVEVEVEWPDAASFDYRHIAETPNVPLDPSTTDTVAFKELLLTQRYKGSVPDFSVVDDVKIKDQNKFSFPTWSDGQQSGITYRSVLLFTRTRTDTSEVTKEGIIRAATGNLDNEEVVIKIVESHHWAQSDVLSEKSIDIGAEIKEGSDIHSSEVKHNGYVMQNGLENARYNGLTYQPNTMTGEIFAVNQESKAQTVVNGKTAAQDGSDDLVVAWYKHYSDDGGINWPHLSVRYSPKWPDKKAISRIVVASRLGTDGLSAKDAITDPSKRQFKFDPARYTDVKVYNQPDKTKPGYNPNEEHALVMPSFFYSSEKPQPKAAFALRNDLNQKDNNEDSYTSDPFVLVQYKDKVTDKFGMQTYHIQYEDEETSDTHASFEVDTSGDGKKDTDGSFKYTFEYPTLAGDLVKAPYPLESIIGAVKVNEIYGRNPEDGKNVYWKDKGGNSWAISGNDGSEFYITFWYPLSDNFWHPTAVSGEIVPFVKNSLQTEEAFTEKSKRQSPYFVSDANVVNYQYFTQQMVGDPRKISDNLTVKYNAYWKPDIPEIRIGETLTFQGGEEKKDDDSISGLPAVIGWKSAELLYDSENDSGEVGKWVDLEGGTAQSSARIQPAVREIRVPLSTEYFPSDLEKSEQTDGWFLKGLNAGLKQRVYYDNKSGHLVLRGILNGRFAGDPQLTASPRDV